MSHFEMPSEPLPLSIRLLGWALLILVIAAGAKLFFWILDWVRGWE